MRATSSAPMRVALVALAASLAATNVAIIGKRARGMARMRRGVIANRTSHDVSSLAGRSHAPNKTTVSRIDGMNVANDVVATSVITTDHDADTPSWGVSSWHSRVKSELTPHFYLEGSNEYAGLGHSFMSFNHLVTLARENDLIPRFEFTTIAHRLNPTRVREYFFGGAFMTPYPTEKEISNCTTIKSSASSLQGDVSGIRNKGVKCAVFIIPRNDTKPRERGAEFNLPLFRELFDANDEKRKSIINRKAEDTDAVDVAVHIRRGDLFWWIVGRTDSQAAAVSQAGLRLVATSAYVEVLRQLLWELAKLGQRTINVRLFCQGMKGNSTVQEVDGKFVDLAAVTTLAAQDPYFMTAPEESRHQFLFDKHVTNYGFVSKERTSELLSQKGMDLESIEKILALADDPADDKLRRAEFVIAMHLCLCVTEKRLALPPHGILPHSLKRFRDGIKGEGQEEAPGQPKKFLLNGSVLSVAFSPGSSDDLQAFDDMCRSDIFITGKSGLSVAVSVLCKKPVVLAIPCWHSYKYIPNAMTLEDRKGEVFLPNVRSLVNVMNSAKFDETRFKSLWQNRKSWKSE